MHVVQQPQKLGLQAMNDVLLAPQERVTMQTAVDGATLLQQQAEWFLSEIQTFLWHIFVKSFTYLLYSIFAVNCH